MRYVMLDEVRLEGEMTPAAPNWLIQVTAPNQPIHGTVIDVDSFALGAANNYTRTFIYTVQQYDYEDEYSAIHALKLAKCAETRAFIDGDGRIYHANNSIDENPTFQHLTNTFQIVVDKTKQRIKFGPEGNIIVSNKDHQGLGIGSYCMSKLIEYIHKMYPNYTIVSGKLSFQDAKDPINEARRDAFYKNLGFNVITDMQGDGSFSASSAQQLKTNFNPQKVSEIDPIQLLKIALESKVKESQQSQQIERLLSEVDKNCKKYWDLYRKKSNYQAVTAFLLALIPSYFYWF